ncbi:MAG: flagellar biosynthetic protein FliO [Candidatus Poseidoniia archaeon]|nr:flagellar biosynthetic protein FliO [Candidatus Poseidoniia archaeon]|tara:strand:+ start:3072 stop:3422 length:351 start_codon:yes stop_codon:yes gene_type:complete
MPEGIDSSYIVRVVIALLFVAGMILAAVWAMRFRLNKMDFGTAQALRVRQKLAIDSKHSIIVIEYGKQEILVGVSPSGLRALYSSNQVKNSQDLNDALSSKDKFEDVLKVESKKLC